MIDTAIATLETHGPDKISLRELAREVGVSPNAPYRHFSDKDELLAAVAQEGFARMTSLMKETTGGLDGRQKVMGLGQTYVQFAQANPSLFRLMFSGCIQEPNDETGESYQLLMQAVAQAAGEEHKHLASFAAWCLVHGMATISLENLAPPQFSQIPVEAITDAIGLLAGDGK